MKNNNSGCKTLGFLVKPSLPKMGFGVCFACNARRELSLDPSERPRESAELERGCGAVLVPQFPLEKAKLLHPRGCPGLSRAAPTGIRAGSDD